MRQWFVALHRTIVALVVRAPASQINRTFMVNYSGTIYHKDLGKRSDVIAKRMRRFDP